MRSGNRTSGIDIIGNIKWGTHFGLFYQMKEDLIDILVPYFKAGLENNELCLWIIPKLLIVDEAVRIIRISVPDFDSYLEKGHIEITLCAHEYINKNPLNNQMTLNNFIEKENQAPASCYDGLRYCGNVFWSGNMNCQDLICYEKSLDEIINNYHALVLCAYFYDICEVVSMVENAFNHSLS